MRRFIVIFSVLAILTVLILPVNGEHEIYEQTIRLHVVANSDTQADQTLKLEIRDEILLDVADYLTDCNTKYEAEQILAKQQRQLKETAERVITEQGYDYAVDVVMGEEYYPTREYESVSLPAGKYYSVRVNIGEAVGQNWWCVLFPPLCVGSATAKAEMVAAGFTPDQIRVLTETDNPRYVLKFKVLEFIGGMRAFLKKS